LLSILLSLSFIATESEGNLIPQKIIFSNKIHLNSKIPLSIYEKKTLKKNLREKLSPHHQFRAVEKKMETKHFDIYNQKFINSSPSCQILTRNLNKQFLELFNWIFNKNESLILDSSSFNFF